MLSSFIKYIKIGLVLLGLLIVFGLIQNALEEREISQKYAEKQPLAETRGYNMGFSLQPPSLDEALYLENFEFIGQNADVALVQTRLDWLAFTEPKTSYSSREIQDLNGKVSLARKMGLKIFLMIDPLSEQRDTLDPVLTQITGSDEFSHPAVQQILKRGIYWAANKYRPEYLGFGSEINTYQYDHPEDFESFFTLYQEIYQKIKGDYPETIMFTSFQYEDLQNLWFWHETAQNPQWGLLTQFYPYVDAIAISTYPSFIFNAENPIPENYYLKLKSYSRTKPIIIAESGYASENWGEDKKPYFEGSPTGQKAFIEKIGGEAEKLNLDLFLYFMASDPDFLPEEYKMFDSIGLRKVQKNSKKELEKDLKPALSSWQKFYLNQ